MIIRCVLHAVIGPRPVPDSDPCHPLHQQWHTISWQPHDRARACAPMFDAPVGAPAFERSDSFGSCVSSAGSELSNSCAGKSRDDSPTNAVHSAPRTPCSPASPSDAAFHSAPRTPCSPASPSDAAPHSAPLGAARKVSLFQSARRLIHSLPLLTVDEAKDEGMDEAKDAFVQGRWEYFLHSGGRHLDRFRAMARRDRSVLELRDAVGATPLHKLLLYNTGPHLRLAEDIIVAHPDRAEDQFNGSLYTVAPPPTTPRSPGTWGNVRFPCHRPVCERHRGAL